MADLLIRGASEYATIIVTLGKAFDAISGKDYELVVLPKHGRLIDADATLEAMNTWDKFGFTHTGAFVREPSNDFVPYVHYEDMVRCVQNMPTVLEASEVEQDG